MLQQKTHCGRRGRVSSSRIREDRGTGGAKTNGVLSIEALIMTDKPYQNEHSETIEQHCAQSIASTKCTSVFDAGRWRRQRNC